MGAMTYRICFVCTGNICRSPMAEVVLRRLVDEAGLSGQVEVDSAGTGRWHVGEGADRRALRTLRAAGYDGSAHRARVFEPGWLADRDLVVALDRGHLRELHALAGDAGARDRVRLLRSFVDEPDRAAGAPLDVADPYYGDAADFTVVLEQVEEACRGLLDLLVRDGTVRPARR
jgi:protein-tyrosine phosphatase